jgi:DNA-binding transcriptional LysR family regulator
MRGVSLRQLRAFSLVASHGSFVHAAAHMHITPSAVSLQIKELEQAVQLALFQRSSKAVSLTPEGRQLLGDVHRVLHELERARDTVYRLRGRSAGTVSVGMVSSAGNFLPRVLAQFRQQCGPVELNLTVGNREQLVDQLRKGSVDLAIMGAPPDDFDTTSTAFAALPLGIVAAPEHPLARARDIHASALAGHSFISRETGSGTRAAMQRYFGTAGIDATDMLELGSDEAVKHAAMANLGIAFVSLHSVALELRNQLLVALDVVGLPVLRRWFVVCSQGAPLTGASKEIWSFVAERGADVLSRQFGDIACLRPAAPMPALAA